MWQAGSGIRDGVGGQMHRYGLESCWRQRRRRAAKTVFLGLNKRYTGAQVRCLPYNLSL